MTLDQEIHALQAYLLQGEGSSFALGQAQQRLQTLLLQRASADSETAIPSSVVRVTQSTSALPARSFAPQQPLSAAASSTLDAVHAAMGGANTLAACQIGSDCAMQAHPELVQGAAAAALSVAQPAQVFGDDTTGKVGKLIAIALAGFIAWRFFLRRR